MSEVKFLNHSALIIKHKNLKYCVIHGLKEKHLITVGNYYLKIRMILIN